jgi:hypothetical protein
MQKSFFFRLTILMLGVFLLAAGGCASTQSASFYTLSPIVNSEIETSTAKPGQGMAIGIGPIKFPEYLEGSQIVTRTGRNSLELAEFHRWAGSLKKDFLRILAENLSTLLSTDRVFLYPWRKSVPIDYQIVVEVFQLDGRPGGNALLVACWNIFSGDGKKVFLARKSSFREPTVAGGYDAFVAAESRALANLSRDIAMEIKTISEKNASGS